MKKDNFNEIEQLIFESKDVVEAVNNYTQNKIRKQWKWFAGVMVLFCMVFISAFCMKEKQVCSPTGIDAIQALADMKQEGKKWELQHIIWQINELPADHHGNLNKESIIRSLTLVNNNFNNGK